MGYYGSNNTGNGLTEYANYAALPASPGGGTKAQLANGQVWIFDSSYGWIPDVFADLSTLQTPGGDEVSFGLAESLADLTGSGWTATVGSPTKTAGNPLNIPSGGAFPAAASLETDDMDWVTEGVERIAFVVEFNIASGTGYNSGWIWGDDNTSARGYYLHFERDGSGNLLCFIGGNNSGGFGGGINKQPANSGVVFGIIDFAPTSIRSVIGSPDTNFPNQQMLKTGTNTSNFRDIITFGGSTNQVALDVSRAVFFDATSLTNY